jgi:carbamate kinase
MSGRLLRWKISQMLIVLALGGEALFGFGAMPDASPRVPNIAEAAHAIVAFAREHAVAVIYSIRPQAGRLAEEVEPNHKAISVGLTGYLLEQALESELPGVEIARLITDDIAWLEPGGPRYADTEDGRQFAAKLGWMVAREGSGFRELIPSLRPQRTGELNTIKALIRAGVLVIRVSGRGIPSNDGTRGLTKGAGTIIVTEQVAAVLADQVRADLLMFLIAADRLKAEIGTEAAPGLRATTVDALRKTWFAPGSIGPEVEAACWFVKSTGKRAAIGALGEAVEVLRGDRGIQLTASGVTCIATQPVAGLT